MAQFQSKERPDYQGTENLEVMSVAVNYNRFLHDQIHPMRRATQAMIMILVPGQANLQMLERKDVKVEPIEIDPVSQNWLNKVMMYILDDIQHGTADYIYSINVLEHVEDDEAVMARFLIS